MLDTSVILPNVRNNLYDFTKYEQNIAIIIWK